MDSRDFDALEGRAREKLSPGAFAFAAGGADDEITLEDNIAAWRRLRLAPRMLRDVTAIDTSTTVLGDRVAVAAGVPYVMATAATVGMEEVAAERREAPHWFQLYLPPDRGVTEGLVDRAAAAGFRAVVLTVDQPVYGSSPGAAQCRA